MQGWLCQESRLGSLQPYGCHWALWVSRVQHCCDLSKLDSGLRMALALELFWLAEVAQVARENSTELLDMHLVSQLGVLAPSWPHLGPFAAFSASGKPLTARPSQVSKFLLPIKWHYALFEFRGRTFRLPACARSLLVVLPLIYESLKLCFMYPGVEQASSASSVSSGSWRQYLQFPILRATLKIWIIAIDSSSLQYELHVRQFP